MAATPRASSVRRTAVLTQITFEGSGGGGGAKWGSSRRKEEHARAVHTCIPHQPQHARARRLTAHRGSTNAALNKRALPASTRACKPRAAALHQRGKAGAASAGLRHAAARRADLARQRTLRAWAPSTGGTSGAPSSAVSISDLGNPPRARSTRAALAHRANCRLEYSRKPDERRAHLRLDARVDACNPRGRTDDHERRACGAAAAPEVPTSYACHGFRGVSQFGRCPPFRRPRAAVRGAGSRIAVSRIAARPPAYTRTRPHLPPRWSKQCVGISRVAEREGKAEGKKEKTRREKKDEGEMKRRGEGVRGGGGRRRMGELSPRCRPSPSRTCSPASQPTRGQLHLPSSARKHQNVCSRPRRDTSGKTMRGRERTSRSVSCVKRCDTPRRASCAIRHGGGRRQKRKRRKARTHPERPPPTTSPGGHARQSVTACEDKERADAHVHEDVAREIRIAREVEDIRGGDDCVRGQVSQRRAQEGVRFTSHGVVVVVAIELSAAMVKRNEREGGEIIGRTLTFTNFNLLSLARSGLDLHDLRLLEDLPALSNPSRHDCTFTRSSTFPTCTKNLDLHEDPGRSPAASESSLLTAGVRSGIPVAVLTPHPLPCHPARAHIHLAPASTQALPAPCEPDVLIPPIPHACFGCRLPVHFFVPVLSLTCPRTLLDLMGRLPAPVAANNPLELFEDLPNPSTTRGNFVHNINESPTVLSQDEHVCSMSVEVPQYSHVLGRPKPCGFKFTHLELTITSIVTEYLVKEKVDPKGLKAAA
ncbi:hypothetical protein FB451DRAFT_1170477 [Mycena latifolia]|nr:hypothetical protein FB451DRAFT_1170477 [Mycena latifolia]